MLFNKNTFIVNLMIMDNQIEEVQHSILLNYKLIKNLHKIQNKIYNQK